jgi:hypothetical protein
LDLDRNAHGFAVVLVSKPSNACEQFKFPPRVLI